MNRLGRAEWMFLGVIVLIASVLSLCNLGNHYLWQDEAQTALISRTVLTHGIPMGYDGRNYFSQESGAEYDPEYRWRWHTWLPFYLLAGFFAVLGESTFVARLPFALAGVGTVVATYGLARAIWQDRRAAGAAAILLTTSIPFLLLVRQCRYYSLTALFTTLAIWGYWRLMRRGRLGATMFVVAAVCLFHVQYIYVTTLLGCVFFHATLWHRDRLKALVGSSGLILLICAPWIVFLSAIDFGDAYKDISFDFQRARYQLDVFVRHLANYIFPLLVLVVPAAVLILRVARSRPSGVADRDLWCALSCLLLLIVFTLIALAWASPSPYFRYLTPLIPIMMVIAARIVAAAMAGHWVFGVLIVGFMISRGRVVDFAYELTHDFDGPIEALVTYLNEHASEDDVVAASYGDLPIKFYTGLRVVGGLTGEDLSPALDAKWIILREHHKVLGLRVHHYLGENLDFDNYEMILLDAPDTLFENREEPNAHLYRTSRFARPVSIMRRIR